MSVYYFWDWAWNVTCLMSGKRANNTFQCGGQSAAETCCMSDFMCFIKSLQLCCTCLPTHPRHHLTCSWLIMDPPDGKWNYLAKPVAADEAELLREHFPSILKQEFGKQTSRLTARLTVCLHVWQWVLVLRLGKGWVVEGFFKRYRLDQQLLCCLKELSNFNSSSTAIKAWHKRVGLSLKGI